MADEHPSHGLEVALAWWLAGAILLAMWGLGAALRAQQAERPLATPQRALP